MFGVQGLGLRVYIVATTNNNSSNNNNTSNNSNSKKKVPGLGLRAFCRRPEASEEVSGPRVRVYVEGWVQGLGSKGLCQWVRA